MPDQTGSLVEDIDAVRRRVLQAGVTGALGSAGCMAGEFSDGGAESATRTESGSAPPLSGGDDSVVSYTYEVPEPGRVSAGVYDADGRLLRTLLRAEEQHTGEHTVEWDGLDRYGRPVDAGEYTIKTLVKPSFEAEFVTQLGVNPDSEPYHRWIGNHNGPSTVAVDATGLYVGTATPEGPPAALKQSLDGSEQMWTHGWVDAWSGAVKLATDGQGTLYWLPDDGKIRVKDATTAETRATWDLLYPGAERDNNGHYMDIAASDATGLVVAYERQDAFAWIGEEGIIADEIEVTAPRAVAIGPSGGVFVASDQQIRQVTRSGAERPIVDGLVAPNGLTIDPTTGDVLVAEGGPDHRIKRFGRDGSSKESYGREGGRRDGPYEPTDFLAVVDIAADGNGGFLVAEQDVAPRRVAHFDEGGSLVTEWYGGQPFFSWTSVDPRDSTRAWFDSNGLVLAEIDYADGSANGSWSVRETHHPNRSDPADPDSGGAAESLLPEYGTWSKYSVRYHDGERYLVGEGPSTVLHHHDGQLDPVVASASGLDAESDVVEHLSELTGTAPDAFGGYGRQKLSTYSWTDSNRDGRPQGDEITLSDTPIGSGQGGVSITDGLSALFGTGIETEGDDRITGLIDIAPAEWTDAVPRYPSPDRWRSSVRARITSPDISGGVDVRHTHEDADGNLYAQYKWGPPGLGVVWPTETYGSRCRITKWTPEGDHRWTVGKHATNKNWGEPTPPGEYHDPSDIMGVVKDTLVVSDRVGDIGTAWTTDGLFAGSLLETHVDDDLPEYAYWWGTTDYADDWTDETAGILGHDCAEGGCITEHDGDVYWIAPMPQGDVVYRIHGWEDWERRSGSVSIDVKPPSAAAEGTGLQGAYFDDAEADLGGTPTATRVDEQVWFWWEQWANSGRPEWIVQEEGARSGNRNGVEPLGGQNHDFAVQWMGELEPKLSEPMSFAAYAHGAVRVVIDGEAVIEAWEEEGKHRDDDLLSDPVPLTAGDRVPIRVDFRTTMAKPRMRLVWESHTQEQEHVPTAYLYPNA